MKNEQIITEVWMEALSVTRVNSIISILEKGLELSKMEYAATQDPQIRSDVSDGCVLLSFLYFSRLRQRAQE